MLDYSEDEEKATIRTVEVPSNPPRHSKGEPMRSFGDTSNTTSVFRNFGNRPCLNVLKEPISVVNNEFCVNNFLRDTTGHVRSPSYPRPRLKVIDFGYKGIYKCFSYRLQSTSGFNPLFKKCIEPLPNTREDHPDSFFMSTKIVVCLAQYFAVLPVSGATGRSHKTIRFRWFHYKILYWSLSLFGTLFYFTCYLRYSLQTGIYTKAASRLVLFISSIISSFLMLHLGFNWRNLTAEFADMEIKLAKYGYPARIGFEFKILTLLFLAFGLVELFLSITLTFYDNKFCENPNGDILSLFKSFFMRHYKEVFQFYTYNIVAGFLMLASNFRTSTVWVFQDLFLGFVSRSIAERFKQIHALLNKIHGQGMPITFWKEIREDYNDLTLLTKRVDVYVQKLMFLAIGNDLFLLCMTLFNSLKNRISYLKMLSLFWSFAFQLVRTVFVAFSAAKINDESKEPKSILYSVPHSDYSSEVRRFLTQLTTNEVSLTGCGFFSVTRSLILTIMGTVITYEIVLVQFNTNVEDFDLNFNRTCIE